MTAVTELRDTIRAAEVMTAPAVSVTADTSVAAAWSVMERHGLRHLLVCANGHCVGLLDDRIVFAQWPMGPLALRRHRVAELMLSGVACVLPNAPLSNVALVMARDGVEAVPVVETDGRVVGIVTASDIVAAVAATATAPPAPAP